MATVAPAQRLSPKVRRLLRAHDLDARGVAGTGAGGRVTPHDVLGAAGVPRRPRSSSGTVLASPLARRLLRDAGVDLTAAAATNDQRRITGADAERIIAAHPADTGTTRTDRARTTPAASTTEVETDVARLVAALGTADDGFLAHNGFELSLEMAVASAAAAVLVRRPDLRHGSAPEPEDGAAYPSIHIGFVAARDASLTIVPDVQHLTVGGLARRARAATAAIGDGAPARAQTVRPTLVVTRGEGAATEVPGPGELGLLTVGDPAPRQVASTDELGHEVVRTRPHLTLRLHPGDERTDGAGEAFLEELRAAVTAWSLPVDP